MLDKVLAVVVFVLSFFVLGAVRVIWKPIWKRYPLRSFMGLLVRLYIVVIVLMLIRLNWVFLTYRG